jgi:hypothetical protein
VYIGEFRQNEKHGQGTWIEDDGTRLTGSFVNSQPHGNLMYSDSTGRSRVGIWDHGKFVQWTV